MLAHVTQNSCFIEKGRHDIIMLLILFVVDELLFQFQGKTNSLQSNTQVFLLLEHTGQVIEGENFKLRKSRLLDYLV